MLYLCTSDWSGNMVIMSFHNRRTALGFNLLGFFGDFREKSPTGVFFFESILKRPLGQGLFGYR